MGQITTILSGKGGVGKTTVAAWLGRALASRGHKVLLVDGDFGLRDLDLVLGAQDDVCFDGGDLLQEKTAETTAVVSLAPTLNFLPASASFRWEDIDGDKFIAFLEGQRHAYDHIVIDSPAGIGCGPEALAGMSDRIVVVTEPTEVSMRNAQRVMSLLQREQYFNYAVVMNRLHAGDFNVHGLEDLFYQLGVDYICGIMPELAMIQSQYREGRLGCARQEELGPIIEPVARFVESGEVQYVDDLGSYLEVMQSYVKTRTENDGGHKEEQSERVSWLRSRKTMQQQSRWRKKW